MPANVINFPKGRRPLPLRSDPAQLAQERAGLQSQLQRMLRDLRRLDSPAGIEKLRSAYADRIYALRCQMRGQGGPERPEAS